MTKMDFETTVENLDEMFIFYPLLALPFVLDRGLFQNGIAVSWMAINVNGQWIDRTGICDHYLIIFKIFTIAVDFESRQCCMLLIKNLTFR